MSDSTCPFCKKLGQPEGWPRHEVVWQFPHSVCLLGTWQAYTGYCVLVSRRHVRELFELEPAERQGFFDEVSLVAQAIQDIVQPLKINYEMLGNQVPHLHCHVFPRSADDPERLGPVWLALDRAERDPTLRERLQAGSVPREQTRTKLEQALTAKGAPRA